MLCDICYGKIEPLKDNNGNVVWAEGNSADPVVEDGRCCDTCNESIVIPARLFGMILK